MTRSLTKLLCMLGLVGLLAVAGALALPQSASAAPHPSFRVVCYPTGMAPNDPIVFPGQAGRSHMHTFFGAKKVNENTTTQTLLRQPSSQCGSHYDTVDLSGYWIPTLLKDGEAVYTDSGAHQLVVYYKRAGGPDGAPVAQAMPRGLKVIAGDMRATTPQSHVTYACAHEEDTGRQHGGGHTFETCASDEVLIAKLVFPDCWDGRSLDSADHKSHMAYSQGARNACPSSHPVKLPQITFEAWYHGVNGPADSFSWSSGGGYTFHGDVMSAWDTSAAANLVNQCINVAFDCNPLTYPNIPSGAVTQSQIDAQLVSRPSPSASSDAAHEDRSEPSEHHDHSTAGHEPSGTASPQPSATPSESAAPSEDPTTESSPTPSTTPSAISSSSTPARTIVPQPTPSGAHGAHATPIAADAPRSASAGASLSLVALLLAASGAFWVGLRRLRSLRRH